MRQNTNNTVGCLRSAWVIGFHACVRFNIYDAVFLFQTIPSIIVSYSLFVYPPCRRRGLRVNGLV